MNPEQLLTSYEAGHLLQVNPSSINNWVRAGRIEAFRTPGGHLRIRVRDLLSFLARHNMPIPADLQSALRKKLLIVDDDTRQLSALRRALKPYARWIEAEFVSNGIDALVHIGSFRPHLVLLDVYMPDLDGLSVCRRLKENEDTKAIDIIVVTAHLTPELEKKALKAGVRCCVQKPIKLSWLLEEAGAGMVEVAGAR